MAQVTLSHVTKHYSGARTPAVDNVSLVIPKGSFTTLLGPSGCGKSSILRIVAGLSKPDNGLLLMDGQNITPLPPAKRNIGMVFQSLALFPHMTISQNVAFGLEMRGISSADITMRVKRALEIVELANLAERYPHQVSGGQQQRAALARALVVEPSILILDEPFSALDRKLRESMQIELYRITRDLGVTAVFVTHDQEEALTLSEKIVVMNHGRIEQEGTPREIYGAPKTRFVADFMGLSNFIAAEYSKNVLSFEGISVPNPSISSLPASCLVALRPEGLSLTLDKPNNPALRGKLLEAIYQGPVISYTVALQSGYKLNARTADTGIQLGQDVWVSWTPNALYAFAA